LPCSSLDSGFGDPNLALSRDCSRVEHEWLVQFQIVPTKLQKLQGFGGNIFSFLP
jgi:hypothetical protein